MTYKVKFNLYLDFNLGELGRASNYYPTISENDLEIELEIDDVDNDAIDDVIFEELLNNYMNIRITVTELREEHEHSNVPS